MTVQGINIPPQLAYVLSRAGDRSDVNFDYLLQTAIRESSLNPTAKASTSSATGLFQFIEDTWFDVLKSDGARLGYGRISEAIVSDGQGGWTIPDKRMRAEVLKLRENPEMAADLAAAFTRRNGEYLSSKFGRMPSPGELYIAHFLGASGAEKMFEAGLSDPGQIAANLFPRAAKANPSIFYADGKARTIKQVYQALVAKHQAVDLVQDGSGSGFAAQQAMEMLDLPGVKLTGPNVSFTEFYRTGGEAQAPVQNPNAGAGLFTKLYSE